MKNLTKIRLALLEGQFPDLMFKQVRKKHSKALAYAIRAMLQATWKHYLLKGAEATTATKTFATQSKDIKAFNQILMALSKGGWITVYSKNNWSEVYLNESKLLDYVTKDELINIRAYNKYKQFMLTNELATENNLVRINGKVKKAKGAFREGFRKAGNTEFMFDTQAMWENIDVIKAEVNKGMTKVRIEQATQGNTMSEDKAMYDEIATAILEAIMYTPTAIYRPGQPINDSRFRNIAGYTDKVFNPVAFKVSRACLLIPAHLRNTATAKGLDNKYLAIAEMAGTFVEGTKAQKISNGRKHYYMRTQLDLDYSNEDDRKDAFENIWLERLYKDIDNYLNLEFKAKIARQRFVQGELSYFEAKAIIEAKPKTNYKWTVPIEIDMSASVLGYVGALTNHKPFLERSNMVGSKLGQAWAFDGLSKKQAKVVMQKIYGSEQSAKDIWTNNNISYTPEQIKLFNSLLSSGELAVGDKFSKFIIHNCTPQPKMTLEIGDESIDIECNRFFNVGEESEEFDLYDTETDSINRIVHMQTKKIPNLEAFKRYFVTALIHNRDGWNEDRVCNVIADEYGFVLDLHDASILCCEAADRAREVYAEGCEIIRNSRNNIMSNYCKSIGVPASAIKAYKEEVQAYVTPLRGKFKCNPMVLK